MATPKGTRTVKFAVNETDSVHVYSDKKEIWLQLRRDYPTEKSIGTTSFKAALSVTPMQAIAIAGELLTVAAGSAAEKKAKEESNVKKDTIVFPENHGKQWSPEEDKQLVSRFHSQLTIEEIAKKHKRGVGGIQARLTKLGKLQPDQNIITINTEQDSHLNG